LASVLKMFQDNVYVSKAFAGIRIAVCALMASAVIKLAKKAVSGVSTAIIAVASLLLEIFLGVSPIIIVASVVVFGIIMYFTFVRKKNEGEKEVDR